jgi:hypothetical protein
MTNFVNQNDCEIFGVLGDINYPPLRITKTCTKVFDRGCGGETACPVLSLVPPREILFPDCCELDVQAAA